MPNTLKNTIADLLVESNQFNANDVLVNALESNKKLVFTKEDLIFSLDSFPNAILAETKKTLKESGANTLCLASGIITLSVNGKSVQTPILLNPLEFSLDKVKKEVKFIIQANSSFVNPFLIGELKKLDVEFTKELLDPDCQLEELINFLSGKGLDILESDYSIIGNFHHHRFQVIKELEELIDNDALSENIQSLFGFGSSENSKHLTLPPDNLFQADTDHESVFNALSDNNVVIQGPPGTGKSQVLTNIIGKTLHGNHTSIFVSEKHVALEVIKKKLSAFGLEKLCFIASSDNLSHTFLSELKTTWDYFESTEINRVNNLRLSEQYEANLQMTLDLIAQENLIGGVSFHKFKEFAEGFNLGEFTYSSEVVELNNLIKVESTIKQIYSENIQSVGYLKRAKIQSDEIYKLDNKLLGWLSTIEHLKTVFTFTSWGDFKVIIKEAAQCQVFENDLYKKYSDIFRINSRSNKKFISLRKKYLKAKQEIERINSNQSHWKNRPSESESFALKNMFENGGFFIKLKAKKRWKELSHLLPSEAVSTLDNHLSDLKKINDYSQIIIKFCELGIDNPEIEVSLIHQTLSMFREDQWVEIEKIPSEERSKMTTYHGQLNDLFFELNDHLNLTDSSQIKELLLQLKKHLSNIISYREKLLALDDKTLLGLTRNLSFNSYKGEALTSHWARFKEQFPSYSEFSMQDISSRVNDIIAAQNSEAKMFAQEIEFSIAEQFKKYHELLNTPARKLDENKKALKARLRKGKSILIKEFAKTRSHPSLREFFKSEAREWIQLLKPVWLSNPTQLAKCFPMERGLFEVAIFDEASQIPVQNALGTLQRSYRIIVAGDDQQMGPTSYFKTKSKEDTDLLHQATYNWARIPLQHHYRSLHPDLIAFSNKHFYENRLKTYPTFELETPIHHHFVESGQFINRQNKTEATAVSQKIKQSVKKKGSIGIVAFSEEQLNCLWTNMDSETQELLTTKLETNQGFFKSLENVQGDECDHLIISLGYAKNEEGEFHMRFGPMNTASGRKRLNVLLTRSKRSIDFFCSIQSSEFKLSDNEAVNLLRQWVSHSESYQESEHRLFPFNLQPSIEGNHVCFNQVHTILSSAKELVTLQSVLNSRGWVVEYA